MYEFNRDEADVVNRMAAVLIYVLVVQTPFLSLESILLRMPCILCLITVANCGTPSPTRPGLCQLLQLLNPLFVI